MRPGDNPAGHRPIPTVLGIDLGTSSCKAAIVDGVTGQVVAQTSREYPVVSRGAGHAETDPIMWWDAVATCVREVVGRADSVPVAIGLSGQMHGLVLCDRDTTPVRSALLWADTRAAAEAARYRDLGVDQRRRLANPITPGMAGPQLLWVAQHEPDVYASARWALQPKDWLRARLTGRVASDPSDASATLLYSLPDDRWDFDLVATLGLRADLLAPLVAWAGEPAGTLTSAAAEHLGLPAGLPVAAGAADTAAAALGSGISEPGQIQLTVGTGAQIVRPRPHPSDRSARGVHLYRSAAPTGWYHMAASTNAGITLSWVRQVLAATWDELYASLDEPIRADDPLFVPHLTGERTPYIDPDLRGSWTGLALGHGRSTLLRSALEGVAFAIAEAYDAIVGDESADEARPPALRLAGGGTAAPAWRQLLADVTDTPLDAVDCPAASARGAALLGAAAAGVVSADDITGRLAPGFARVAEPDHTRLPLLTERRRRFHDRVITLSEEVPRRRSALLEEEHPAGRQPS